MAVASVDVVGTTPISFTNSEGAQTVVPLSALEFAGSDLRVKAAWTAVFDASEKTTLLALARARAAIGELTPPPSPPPRPALAFTATHVGPEGNGIVVTAAPDPGPPLTATIAISAAETDTWPGLATGADAAMAIGVDAPTGTAGDPEAGTGLVVVKQGSVGASVKRAKAGSGVLKKATGVDIKDLDDAVIFTLLPRADYVGKDGLSYAITVDGSNFTVSATYDSTKEAGAQAKVTIQTLGDVPDQVAYLVTASAPPSGAALPVAGSAPLSGGSDGLAANGLLYTS